MGDEYRRRHATSRRLTYYNQMKNVFFDPLSMGTEGVIFFMKNNLDIWA